VAATPEPFEGRGDVRVHRVLEEPDRLEALAVVADGLADERVVGGAQQVREGVAERRADVPMEGTFGGRLPAEGVERVLEATRDPGAGVGQRAIEVEKDEQGGSLA
jgi:hypothetical protein